jgi:3-methylfumaryl-CoA hydratase
MFTRMTVTPIDIDALRAWIGRQHVVEDALPSFPATALAATLDRDERLATGDALPPLWHWVYFLDLHKSAELDENGHARQGDFLPVVPFPRRMFAGARLEFHRPLRIGEPARRVSTIANVELKRGSSGDLLFLVLRHEFHTAAGLALTEEQDIVYRQPGGTASAPPAGRATREEARWQRTVEANEMVLFRYSALIFNAHRIHWDRPYAVEREGYPGLIVHGQLIATWLADLLRRHSERALERFRFRSVRALLDHARCRLCAAPRGDAVALWAEDERGAPVMEAQATLA